MRVVLQLQVMDVSLNLNIISDTVLSNCVSNNIEIELAVMLILLPVTDLYVLLFDQRKLIFWRGLHVTGEQRPDEMSLSPILIVSYEVLHVVRTSHCTNEAIKSSVIQPSPVMLITAILWIVDIKAICSSRKSGERKQ